jgi:hypothetical protein
MGSIRNVSGRDIFTSGSGAIKDGEVAEVPDDQVYAYTASANFEPVGSDSKALHDQGAKEEKARVEAEAKLRRAAMGTQDQPIEDEPEPEKKAAKRA